MNIEWAWMTHPIWKISLNEHITIGISFLIGTLYVSIEHPKIKCIEDKQLSLAFHNNAMWWNIWTPSMSWSSTTPWYRNGSFHFDNFIFGDRKYSEKVLETRTVIIPMPERNYTATAKRLLATWKRSRWPWPLKIQRLDISMHPDNQIPFPGKGENSWDCDEDATYSSLFPGDDIDIGIGKMVGDILQTRRRRAGNNWKPKSIKENVK